MTAAMGLLALFGNARLLDPLPLMLVARIVAHVAHAGASAPGVVAIALVIHFAYGALASGFLAVTTPQVTVGKGLVLGLGLWAIMMVFWLPMSGNFAFSLATDPWFWVVSLGLHAIYGAMVGWLVERHESHRPEEIARLFSE